MLVLIIGDFWIPEREIDLPTKFKKLLVPGKISSILVTGNTDPKTIEYLSTICPTIITKSTVEYEGFKIGLMSGWDKEVYGRASNVDIVVSGGSHVFEAYEKHGRFYVDPGSATGAFTLDQDEVIPSFVLMDVRPNAFSLYIYKLITGQVKVEKMDYSKPL
ncbi:Vacuolar protein sorting-associated protein 29 [Boothiomyces macroporosus]|uniref:Vacuolar protein sorting-associated protein 29 n=1 Tax=Boothiomyces macroporosus TaxID=261099 RepID=A0AAD5UII9_9FUNG|nr:Vacuolar protein sorting-associated protein 29 [Boothiomyces macroporosus]